MNAFPTGGAPFCCRFDARLRMSARIRGLPASLLGAPQSLRPSIDSEFAKQLHKSL
jgi:hypothetical protein